MKYGKYNVGSYNELENKLKDLFSAQAWEHCKEHDSEFENVEDWGKFINDYIVDKMNFFKAARRMGVKLLTDEGYIHGYFVGSVEYTVNGDPINGFEANRDMAFKTDSGRIVRAHKRIDGTWALESLKGFGTIIHWDEYPVDWNAVLTRPETIKRPVKKIVINA